jgi:hypothetical protein
MTLTCRAAIERFRFALLMSLVADDAQLADAWRN